MNGRRGYSNSSASSGNYVSINTKTNIGSRSISNYNVGRNESEINNNNSNGNNPPGRDPSKPPPGNGGHNPNNNNPDNNDRKI